MATLPRHALNPPPPPAAVQPWVGEERLVREAILMVASRGAPRVLVAGLTFGEQVLDRCRRSALEAGVRIRVRPASTEDRLDVIVEAVG
jgi:hypothetical protein